MRALKFQRLEAEGIPHTDVIDMDIPVDEDEIVAFSGHVPIAMEAITLVLSVLEDDDRVLAWETVHTVIHDLTSTHGWLFDDLSFVRDYNIDADPDVSMLKAFKKSADYMADMIWLFKNLIQETGVRTFVEIAKVHDRNNTVSFETVVSDLEEALGVSYKVA